PEVEGSPMKADPNLPPPVGLSNVGNSCFFNSVLQALCHSNVFASIVRQHIKVCSSNEQQEVVPASQLPLKYTLDKLGPMTIAFSNFCDAIEVARNISLSNGKRPSRSKTISPKNLFNQLCNKNPKFRGHQQQDSQEFYHCLLDGLRQEEIKQHRGGILRSMGLYNVKAKDVGEDVLKRVKGYGVVVGGQQASYVGRIFGGGLISSVQCDECKVVTKVTESFLDISLPILEDHPPRNPRHHKGEHVGENGATNPPKNPLSKHALKKARKQARREARHSKHRDDINNNSHEKNGFPDPVGSFASGAIELETLNISEEESGKEEEEEEQEEQEEGSGEQGASSTSSEDTTDKDSSSDEDLKHSAMKTPHKVRNPCCMLGMWRLSNPGITPSWFQVWFHAQAHITSMLDIITFQGTFLFIFCPSLKKKLFGIPQECTVESCFHQFTKAEMMTGSNKFGCDVCTRNQSDGGNPNITGSTKTIYCNASKQMVIDHPPVVLTVHLKRFQQVGFNLRKVNKHVGIPLVLDLASFCTVDCQRYADTASRILYELYAVVEHSGSLSRGHYTAYVKVREANKKLQDLVLGRDDIVPDNEEPSAGVWYHTSDTQVTKTTQAKALNCNAYMLFYERIV
uniref:Ubiquitin carboxyl-terminal hydrolase n=1 Tax=Ciona savignyi TaxID=51511 RepID=H2YSG1_CIOSA